MDISHIDLLLMFIQPVYFQKNVDKNSKQKA